MLDSPDDLLNQIRLGEDSSLECKTLKFAGQRVAGPSRESIADEIAAFANAKGGVLVLGVDDKSRDIVGIPLDRLDVAERFIVDLVRDVIEPELYPDIRRLELVSADGVARPVIRVDVPSSLFVHRSPGGYFYRVGSSKRVMGTEYLARLLQQRSQAGVVRHDETPVAGASLLDLDDALVDRFQSDLSDDDRPTLLTKLAMARTAADGELRPTIAGLLLGCRFPQASLKHAFIQAVAYRGDDLSGDLIGYQLDAQDLGGPLDAQVEGAYRFVQRNMRVDASKVLGRHDLPQYDLDAILEALVNAVAHRDYSMYQSKIRLRMFRSRLELHCPGPLANTMDVETLAHRQATRNEAITSLLARIPVPSGLDGLTVKREYLMEKRGEGVPMIIRRSLELSGRRPVYRMLDESELMLTIHAASALEMHANLKPRLGSS